LIHFNQYFQSIFKQKNTKIILLPFIDGILTNMKLVGYFENVQIWKTVDELIKEYQNTVK